MSKIIASAAIRGAHSIVAKAEEKLKQAIDAKGPNEKVEFPNTGYYLPVIYGLSGIKVEKLSDMEAVLKRAKELLPEVPSEKIWLPYLGPTLDAGVATLFAEEIIEALRYVTGPSPIDELWLGAADDVIMRARGVEFVDGSAPGFAAVVGAAPSDEIAVSLAREMQEKGLYVFMAGHDKGLSFAEQLANKDVQLGWDTRLVPFGKEVYGQIYSLGFATRAAMAFGGVEPGDFARILRYNKNRIFAFVVALGEVSDEWYATAAGAISYGFPTIADSDIPQILPTGVCTYEHVVSNIPHDKIVSKAIEVRGLKIAVTKIPVPVAYGPAFEGERIRKEDTYVEFGGQKSPAFELLRMKEMAEVEDGKIEVVGPEIDKVKEGSAVPLGIVVSVAGRKMQPDFEPILERQVHHFINGGEGIWHMGQRNLIWMRISKAAKEKGFKISHFGEILVAKLKADYSAITDKVQVTIYTEEAKVKKLMEESKVLYGQRDERVAGLKDESVDTFYSCTLCIPKGQDIVLPDGSFKDVENVIVDTVDYTDTQVLSLDANKLKAKPIGELFINPAPASLIKIGLNNGNSLVLTSNHRVLRDTKDGLFWTRADQLARGDYVVSAARTSIDSKEAKRYFHVIDFLPDDIKIYDDAFLQEFRKLIFDAYGNLGRAAREFGLSYERVYSAFYRKEGTSYRLGHQRFTLGEVKSMVSKLGLEWNEIKGAIKEFGTSRGYRISRTLLDEDILYVAGLVAADGCVVKRGNGSFVQFTNSEKSLVERFNQITRSLFGTEPEVIEQRPKHSASAEVRIFGKNTIVISHVHNSLVGPLLRGLGIGTDRRRSRKWTGEIISTLTPRLIAAFLRGLFDGDGHVTKNHILITTRSYKEAQHIHLLLKKLGISSYITEIKRGFQVGTRNYGDIMAFREIISTAHPRKRKKMQEIQLSFDDNHVVRSDGVPFICNRLIKEILEQGNGEIKVTKLPVDYKTIKAWTKGKSRASKEKLRILLNSLKGKINISNPLYGELSEWCNSLVTFEKIRKIEKVSYAEKQVYNFSVEDTHNYLVNGVVVKNCQSFAPNHICIISPERLGLCGAYNWLDGKAAFEINPTGPNQPVTKGETIEPVKGQWGGVNEFVYNKSNKSIEKFNAYSMLEDPMTSCGCFECIVAILPLTNGVMVVNREFSGMTPSGMKFSTLAGTVGGGAQTPGFIGVGRQYITSEKFISADGGFSRLVWMPKELKDQLRPLLQKRAEAVGQPDFVDKIADETVAVTEEEVMAFMEKVGHPALALAPML